MARGAVMSVAPQPPGSAKDPSPGAARDPGWLRSVGPEQWLVLVLASAGWVFDAYASQVYNITRDNMLAEVLHRPAADPSLKFWGEALLGVYLVGGALGGTFFGALADRIGRRPTMSLTILTYAVFSGLTAFVHTPWQAAVLRFLVALGTAGEWAVAASLVAETFPPKVRAEAGALFHSTSNIGTWLAALVGLWVGTHWRLAYLTGVAPALLVFWIRARAPESKSWSEAKAAGNRPSGSLSELLFSAPYGRRALLGMSLAAVGLGTYWCLTVGGQDLIQDFLMRHGMSVGEAASRAKFGYGFLINGGGFAGALAFGLIAQKFGRKRAFIGALVGGALVVPATWYLPQNYGQLLVMLPLYGFLTFGFHAGFALYFPELFPTRLRGTGTGFCFNGGRLAAAGILLVSGWLKSNPSLELRLSACLLASLYLVGCVFVALLPETKDSALS